MLGGAGSDRECTNWRVVRKLKGFVLLVHPLPILGVCSIALLLGLSLADTRQQTERLLLVVAAIFFSQLVVGITNDLVDLEQDKLAQPWKPLVAGWLTKRDAVIFLSSAIVLLSCALFLLMPGAQACVLVGTFAGLLHNFWLKGTRYDWLAYALGFLALPLAVWLELGRWQVEQALLFIPASFLLAANIVARDLPDIESDRAAGKRSLAVRLGEQKAIYVVCIGLILAGIAAGVALTRVPLNLNLFALGLALYFLISLVITYRYLTSLSVSTLRANFRLVLVSAVTLVAFSLFALRR